MSLLTRVQRFFTPVAADPAMDDRFFQPIGGHMAAAGVPVTPETAVKVSAVYRCVSLLANAFASLPFGVYERLDRGRREIPDADASRIFNVEPNPYQIPFVFRRLMMGHLALRGNCYARIVQGQNGPELWPLHPDRVTGPELLESGRLRYTYQRPDNARKETYIGGLDIMHITGLSSDGLRGLALSDIAKDSIGLAMATEQYGSRLFSQGVRLAGVLKTAGKMDEDAASKLSKSFRENWGGQRGAFGVPVLEQGLEFQSIGMSSEDAQFLETRKFEVSDIARWFGIPPHMIGDVERSTSWGSGIEAQSVQFVQYGLIPWLVLWEQTIRAILVPEPDRYARFNVEGLLRADAKTRHDIYQIGVQIGMYSPNDCRELEERNPREGGDVYVTPRSPNEPVPQTGAPKQPPDEPDEDDSEAEATTHREELARAAKAVEALANANARALVSDEVRGLTRMAKEHTKDDGAWRAAVASFYGRRVGRIEDATRCDAEAAGTYCVGRRDAILAGGMKACEESREKAVELLVAMTMRAAVGGQDAAA